MSRKITTASGAVTNADLSFSTRAIAEQAPRKLQQDLDVHVAVGIGLPLVTSASTTTTTSYAAQLGEPE